MIGYFAEVAPDNQYIQCHHVVLPCEGQIEPADPANTLFPVNAPPALWVGKTSTEVLHLLDGVEVWVETASLEQLRAAHNTAINAWKLEANNTYFEFAGEQIRYADADRIEIQAVHNWITLTNTMPTWPDWPGAWKAISNRWVPLPDVDTWKAFTLAIAERGTAHFKRAQILKARVTTAATAEELESITW